MRDIATTRRQFLKGTAALVVGFSIDGHQTTRAQGGPPSKSVSSDQVDGFIAVDAGGQVTLYAGRWIRHGHSNGACPDRGGRNSTCGSRPSW